MTVATDANPFGASMSGGAADVIAGVATVTNDSAEAALLIGVFRADGVFRAGKLDS